MYQTSIQQLESVFKDDFLKNIKVIKMIGEGSFAKVFLIYDQQQKIQLAAKRISLFGLCDYQRKLVLNQAKILSSIIHPNIIHFHSCIYDSKQQHAYIFMQYAAEGDLANLIYKSRLQKSPINQSTIWKIIVDITQGLNYLHENGIIHRDIKPANILISQGKYKLADMNVSKIKEKGKIMTRTNVGTPLYTSPQVAKKLEYNEKCDVWSLGVVIYELCCLRNPFNLQSLTNFNSFNDPNSFLDYIPQNYSSVLNKLIRRMLQRDPNQRIQVKAILQICQAQGLDVNVFNGKAEQFKTIVFPATSQRWVNLVANKTETTDSMISLEKQLHNQEQNNTKSNEQSNINNINNINNKNGNSVNNKFLKRNDSIMSIQQKMNEQQTQNHDSSNKNNNINQMIDLKLGFNKKDTKLSQFMKLPKIQQIRINNNMNNNNNTNNNKNNNNNTSSSSNNIPLSHRGAKTSRSVHGIKITSSMNSKTGSENVISNNFTFLYRNRSRTKDYQISHSNQTGMTARNMGRFIKLTKDLGKNSG